MSRPPADKLKCAVCGKAQTAEFRPFCSKRCRNVDLARWLGGHYAIPSEEPPDGSPAAPEDDG